MTETVSENAEVAGYLAAIRDALIDLEPAVRDDLLEDLEAHLHEVLAESGGASLESSLGSPWEYADELRVSAGLEPIPDVLPSGVVRWQRRIAGWALWPVLRGIAGQRWALGVREFVPTLRPGWWVLRGWLLAFACVLVLDGQYSRHRQRLLWIPTDGGTGTLAFVSTFVLVLASIWVGLRTLRLPAAGRVLVGLANACLVLVALVFYNGFSTSGSSVSTASSYFPQQPSGLNVDGRQLVNIFPYDASGHLLHGVRLYDDRGKPLGRLADQTDRGEHLVRSYPTDSAGRVVTNAFPQAVEVQPFSGPEASASAAALLGPVPASGAVAFASAVAITPPALEVPPLAGVTASAAPPPTPVPSATPTPSQTPTPTPTPTKAKGTKASPPTSKPSTRATTTTRTGAGRSRTP